MKEHAEAGKPVDMTAWFNFMTFDIIGDMAFGDHFGSLESGQWHPWVDIIFRGIKFNGIMQIIQAYPIMGYLIYAFSSEARQLAAKFEEQKKLARAQTEKRIAQGAEARLDFMTYILRYNKDGESMSEEDLHQNTNLLLIGGSETTATALSGLMFLLTRPENRTARDTLIDEIRSAGYTKASDITMVSTAPLRYLHACIEEQLRMYPPAVMTPPRVSPGDIVAGQFIPKGVSKIISYLLPQQNSRSSTKIFLIGPMRYAQLCNRSLGRTLQPPGPIPSRTLATVDPPAVQARDI